MAIYSLSSGMERVDVDTNDKRNNLERGRVLLMEGYNCPEYAIVENLGISDVSGKYGYGARYKTVKLDDLTQGTKDAFTLRYISDKKDSRIQVYITDKILGENEVARIWEQSEAKRKKTELAQQEIQKEKLEMIAAGKLLYEKYIPADAQALVLACFEVDDCDIMTDYFGTKTRGTVVLGWSKHKRDVFAELRKHAGKIPETEHLAVKPDVNSNGEPKTEINKSWWHPADEHREKHSMGSGYYLKTESSYSTGWKVYKYSYNIKSDEIYISLAKRCIFEERGNH